MGFALWLEMSESSRKHWERFFLGLFHLEKEKGGLSKNVEGFDSREVLQNAEFRQLSQDQQNAILRRIDQGIGTIGDLVDIASDNVHDHKSAVDFGV